MKVKKIKPISFSDCRSEDVVTRTAICRGDYSADNGRSYYSVGCPFCNGTFIAYKWSLRGGGKRCPDCKALMGSTWQMFQWKSLVEEK